MIIGLFLRFFIFELLTPSSLDEAEDIEDMLRSRDLFFRFLTFSSAFKLLEDLSALFGS